jgi:hypothetical protein
MSRLPAQGAICRAALDRWERDILRARRCIVRSMAKPQIKAQEEVAAVESASSEEPEAAESDLQHLRAFFSPLFAGTGGIDSWLVGPESGKSIPRRVATRLAEIDSSPLSRSQLNQLLVLSEEAGLSEGFFRYYWKSHPPDHTYDVTRVPGFSNEFLNTTAIRSLHHLKWGLYRFYVDALLYFGNIRSAYRFLRNLNFDELTSFFSRLRIDTDALTGRGEALPLRPISKDDRYLIAEVACKSFLPAEDSDPPMLDVLVDALQHFKPAGTKRPTVRNLLEGDRVSESYADRKNQFIFSAQELLDEEVVDEADLSTKYGEVAGTFQVARGAALENTRLYLSMLDELDVYVATSMREPRDFREMADFCEAVFSHHKLKQLQLRYFDPTLSAAEGHEDKGLIECLMVKCAKVLVYSAGEGESWGKDAEAAMALSLGKPVIFYCNDAQRERFYRDVHPLSRLIDFKSGVPVGAIVTSKTDEVVELLARIFENRMEYEIDQDRVGHLRLRERLTDSVIRLQTSDSLLRETFWNYDHQAPHDRESSFPGVGAPRSGEGQ